MLATLNPSIVEPVQVHSWIEVKRCGPLHCHVNMAWVCVGKAALRGSSAQLWTKQGGSSPGSQEVTWLECAGLCEGGADGARARQPALGRRLPHEDHLAPGARLGALPGLLHCLPGAGPGLGWRVRAPILLEIPSNARLGALPGLVHRLTGAGLGLGCRDLGHQVGIIASKRSMPALAPSLSFASTCAPECERACLTCRWAISCWSAPPGSAQRRC